MNSNKMSLTSFGSWQLVKRLGAGAFGEVHHWKHQYTGQEIATKRLKPDPKLRPDEINTLLIRWSQEYEWMQRLTTECIVAAVSVDDEEFEQYLRERSHVSHNLPVIMMQYCNGGDLREHLNKIENMNGLNEYEVRSILYSLMNAISYLHNKCNIEHRDIKPENIVLHIEGNRRIYKLTDFGYAREIPESTIAQSVVGTRNYVAPEVVDPGIYTQSVDYWSAGHVAYEIICGTLPFLPHVTTFVKRIEAIKSMKKNCINIVQKFECTLSDDDNFEYGYHLPLNNCSSIFIQQIESWLRLTFDINYKTRGYDVSNELKFFSRLAEILENNKILTVFSIKKHQKFFYEINSFSNMLTFVEKLSSDNNININNLFVITPPLHPNKIKQIPSDYFVEEWCDTSKEENPPVMLYVGEYIKQESDPIDIEKYFTPYKIAIKCFGVNPQDRNIPSWFIQQIEKELHLLLAKQQNLLTCCMMGLQGFALEIENNVFCYEKEIGKLNDKILILQGNLQVFSTIVDEVIKRQNGPLPESTQARINNILTQTEQLRRYNNEVKIMYKSLLQECRKLAQPEFYNTMIAEDRFSLNEYRSFLTGVNGSRERLEEAQRCFENCVNKFKSFLGEKDDVIDAIDCKVNAFNSLRCSVMKMMADVNHLVTAVEKETRSFLNVCFTENALSSQMHSLNIDENTSNILFNSTNSELNDLSLAMNCNSMTLISDSLELMDIINQQCNTMNDS